MLLDPYHTEHLSTLRDILQNADMPTPTTQTLLITGATRGLGLVAAQTLLADGKTKVITTGRVSPSLLFELDICAY